MNNNLDQKLFVYVDSWETFNKLKVSSDPDDSMYQKNGVQTLLMDGEELDIKWEQIAYIHTRESSDPIKGYAFWTHGALFGDVTSLETAIANNADHIENLTTLLSDTVSRVTDLETGLQDAQEELVAVNTLVSSLSSDVADVVQSVNNMSATVENHGTRITALEESGVQPSDLHIIVQPTEDPSDDPTDMVMIIYQDNPDENNVEGNE